jgi:hypothetical protein
MILDEDEDEEDWSISALSLIHLSVHSSIYWSSSSSI